MSSGVQSVAYLRGSRLSGSALELQTGGGLSDRGLTRFPRFFDGFLTAPEAAAGALLVVADIAGARYYQPRAAVSLDPVVTGNGDRLRFESFSGCCGVHARLDVLPDGIDGAMTGTGTTNVDINPPLREALAKVGGGAPLHLSVGPDDVTVSTFDGPIVEKKVPLPRRWVRGFGEVQVITAGFDLRAELSAAEAVRFLRSLPLGRQVRRGGQVQWAAPVGRSLMVTSRPGQGAVCLAGPERLGALTRVLRHATGLRVYGPAVTSASGPVASAWEVVLPGMRVTVTLSPDAARGFSGEGAVLTGLAGDAGDADLVSVLLAWEPTIDVADIAGQAGMSVERVRQALTRLGAAGRIGYDVAEAGYFHRELPYDSASVDAMNPRLRAAHGLVAAGAVTIDGATAAVLSGENVRMVRLAGGGSCTCLWWSRYRGGRGPCKHLLAAQLVAARSWSR